MIQCLNISPWRKMSIVLAHSPHSPHSITLICSKSTPLFWELYQEVKLPPLLSSTMESHFPGNSKVFTKR